MASLDEEPSQPAEEMVILVSKEGHEFFVAKEAAMASGIIRTMLTGPGKEPADFMWSEVKTERFGG